MHLTNLLATLPPELRDYVRGLEERATALAAQAAMLEAQTATLETQAATLEMQATMIPLLKSSGRRRRSRRQSEKNIARSTSIALAP